MDTNSLNNKLLKTIKQNLSEDVPVLDMLMKTLDIGKEAAYRRIRGDVPFSLLEAVQLSNELHVSLDHIINTKSPLSFELRLQPFYFEKESFPDYGRLVDFLTLLKMITQQPSSEFALSSNTFALFPGHMFYHIFKYTTFKYMYERENLQKLIPFSEIDITEPFFNLNKDIIYETMNIKETSYIFYSKFFENFVDELKYFQSIKLINKTDIDLIKNDLNKFIDLIEHLTLNRQFYTGNKVNLYISNIRLDTSYSYLTSNVFNLSMIGAFSVNHLTSSNEIALEEVKERIYALKRVSELISGSEEKRKRQFINEQRQFIDTL